jgi:tetratricopeptide (TPR) repeat protein
MNEKAVHQYLARLQAGGSAHDILGAHDPKIAEVVRRCAIPHHFGRETLPALIPEMSPEEATAAFDAIQSLSVVIEDVSGLALHDDVRADLFRRWLTTANVQLQDISKRLVMHYAEAMNGISEPSGDREALANRMFHTLAYDQREGTRLLLALFQRGREEQSPAYCQRLIEWAREYGELLTEDSNCDVLYCEAVLATDRRDWDTAIRSFSDIIEKRNGTTWAVKACAGLAHAYTELKNWPAAIEVAERARRIAQEIAPALLPDVLLVLGRAYRGCGDLDLAEMTLSSAVREATSRGNDNTIATTLNALGALHRKRNDPRAAIEVFERSTRFLKSEREKPRLANVLANIGSLQLDLNKWSEGESSLSEALSIQRSIGDRHGEAATLNNLLRCYLKTQRSAMAINTAEDAIGLFIQSRDFHAAAVARSNLSRILRKQGDFQGSRHSLQEAITLFERSNALPEADAKRRELLELDAQR